MPESTHALIFPLLAAQFALYGLAWAAYSLLALDTRGSARHLALFDLLICAGMTLAWTRDDTRAWLPYVGASLCFVAGFMAAWRGLALFVHAPPQRLLQAFIFWPVALVLLYAGPGVEQAALRAFATFFGCGIVVTIATVQVGPLMRREFSSRWGRMVRLACVATILLMSWRAFEQLSHPRQLLELNNAKDGMNVLLLVGVLLVAALFNFSSLGLLLLRYIRQLHRLTHHDPLTDLLNRRAFEEATQHEWSRRQRAPAPLAVAAFDLDHFKQVNDTHGHAAGDAVLVHTAALLRRLCREADLVARLGGEEFVVVMPDTNEAEALAAAERMRQALAAEPAPLPGGGTLRITASIGLAMAALEDENVHDTLKRADAALYRAKKGGRNRVEQAPPLLAPPGFSASVV